MIKEAIASKTVRLNDALFALAVIATLVAALPVSYAAGVPDLSGAFALTLTWLFMGVGVLYAMKKSGAFSH